MEDAVWVEVQALERAAEQLKADVAKMEAEAGEERRRQQLRLFKAFDADGSGTIDAGELMVGLRELQGQQVDEGVARRLLYFHDKDNDGALKFEEFNLAGLERTLDDLRRQDWEAEVAERKQRREDLQRLEAEREAHRMMKEYYASLPPANEDTGFLTRISSVLMYMLPILDSLRFGIQLSVFPPAAQSALHALSDGPLQLMNTIPFGQLIAFVLLQSQCNNTALPVLLRYNMRQAVVLDIAVGFLHLTQILAAMAFFGEAPPADMAAQWESNIAVFVVLLGCVAYASGKSLLGQLPDELPWVSAYAEKYLAPTRPSDQPPFPEHKDDEPRGSPPSE